MTQDQFPLRYLGHLPLDRGCTFSKADLDSAAKRCFVFTTHAVSIEKDFWVCWTLRELFQLPEWGSHLSFKGGTSLAKGWKLIERFSEDIDVVIERDFLGFGGDRGPEHAPSKKQQRVRLDALKAECKRRIHHSLLPALAARFKSLLPADTAWKLEEDPADPDGQSLSFFYPAVIETASYVQPVVKIELGARSETEPSETPQIQSYLAEAFPQILGPDIFSVRAVAPRRTFWEKSAECMRKHGEAPACFLAIESVGLYTFGFERGEIFEEFIQNVLLLCRARDLEAGILTCAAARGKVLDPKLSLREVHCLTTQVGFVAENRQGQRIEKALPIIRDAAGNFTGFGEYTAEKPDPLVRKFPKPMLDRRPTASERLAARTALTNRGIILNHDVLDAAKDQFRPTT